MPPETETLATSDAFVIGPGFQERIDVLGLQPLGPGISFAPDYSFILADKVPPWYSQYTSMVVGPFEEALG